MRTLIWGAGAIGGTIGAYLIRDGQDVAFVDRAEDHVAAINEKGLTIRGTDSEFSVQARAYTPDTVEGVWECVLLCTKAQDTDVATVALKPHLADDGFVVSVQNGLNELSMIRIVGEERVIGSFFKNGADYLSPGLIRYGGRGSVVMGELDGRDTDRIQRLHKALLAFDPKAFVTSNIWGYQWGKLAYAAVVFVTALTNASTADALADRKYRRLFIDAAREVVKVAAAEGVRPEDFVGFQSTAFLPTASEDMASAGIDDMEAYSRKSIKTHSGMWRDIAVHKRKTEVDVQLGMIVQMADQHGIEVPVLKELIRIVHEIEDGLRPQDWSNLDALMAARP